MERYAKVLLYGDFGTWKTTTALRYSSNCKIYATDDGWISGDNHPNWIDMSKVYIQKYEGRSQLLAEDFSSVHDTYILDTYSEMIEIYLDNLMHNAKWGGRFREKMISNDKELKDTENPAPADYHVIRNYWRPVARRFLLAPKDVFILSHENDPIEGLSKDMAKRPVMPSKVFKALAQNCHVIGRMSKRGKGVFIDVEGSDRVIAKSRIGSIKGSMTPDDFLEALHTWKKGN